jgi:hypothetical protein
MQSRVLAENSHFINRWAEYKGESLANVFRLLMFVLVGTVTSIVKSGFSFGSVTYPDQSRYFFIVGMILHLWPLVVLAVAFCLRQKYFPKQLMYATTVFDIFLLTLVLSMTVGAASPASFFYFVIIYMAALRRSGRLILVATTASIAGYLMMLDHAELFDFPVTVVPAGQITMLLSIAMAGALAISGIQRRSSATIDESSEYMPFVPRSVFNPSTIADKVAGYWPQTDDVERCSECGATSVQDKWNCWLCNEVLGNSEAVLVDNNRISIAQQAERSVDIHTLFMLVLLGIFCVYSAPTTGGGSLIILAVVAATVAPLRVKFGRTGEVIAAVICTAVILLAAGLSFLILSSMYCYVEAIVSGSSL